MIEEYSWQIGIIFWRLYSSLALVQLNQYEPVPWVGEQYLYDIGGRLRERVTQSGNRMYDGKETRLAKKIEAANEKGQEEECEVGQIGEKAVDIAAIALAGYTLSEIIAILAEYWGMEYTPIFDS